MTISFPLVAKGLAGLAAIGAPVTLSVVYKDNISNLLSPAAKGGVANPKEKPNREKINEKLKELGISKNECQFLESDTSKECDLNKSDLESLKFVAESLNVSDNENSKLVKLKIELPESVSSDSSDSSDVFEKLKFTFLDIQKDITIGSESNQITIKKNTNPEFKLNSAKDKLEKTWTIEKLSEKVGLKCPKDDSSSDKCTLADNKKINVKNGEKKSTDVSFSSGELKFEKDQEGYNQGFKFTVSGESDITLSKTGSGSLDPNKIEKTNSSYEIIKDNNIWYLSKVTPRES